MCAAEGAGRLFFVQVTPMADGALSVPRDQGGAVFCAPRGPQPENGLRGGNHKMQCGGMESPHSPDGMAVPAKADLESTFAVPIPLQDHILVRRHPAVTHIGNIEIPGSARTKPKKGTVLEVGPGRVLDNGERAEMELHPGDVVYFSPYAGLNLEEIAREDGFLVMVQEDVLCRDHRPGETHFTAERKA